MIRYFITYAINVTDKVINFGNISLDMPDTISGQEDIDRITGVIARHIRVGASQVTVMYWRKYDSPL
jgi:hypothetical protein